MNIRPQQIKAARAWIDWSREQLADAAGVSSATIRNLERGHMTMRSAADVRIALEKVGFRFHGRSGFQLSEQGKPHL
jgi:DNA-binding XRE family transcriptional regulator